MDTDRNLLFGVLALQADLLDNDQFAEACSAWAARKHTSLADLLLERGWLTGEDRGHVEYLLERKLKKHGGDAHASLAAVAGPEVRRALDTVNDAEVEMSLASLPALAPHASELPTADLHARPASGRYRVLRPHAKGGLGEVFVAEDTELHRSVALKEIQARYADQPDSRSRFVLEAEITGGLEHPGIVPVYGLSTYPDGRPYYAMRFIQGDSLKEALIQFHEAPDFRSAAFRQLLRRFVDVCNAVAYAHSRGVLHRDLKPANVMLGPFGETLVVDWGLAKVVGRERTGASGAAAPAEPTLQPASAAEHAETVAGIALGTPAYMSPEQAAGRLPELSPASDIYSLGATLYAVLTGRAPFEGSDKGDLLRQVQRGEFSPPRQVQGAVPPALDAVCRKAMALQPAARYSTPLALAADVERWLADEPVSAHREPWTIRVRRWLDRHRIAVSAAATVLHGLIWGTAFLWLCLAVPAIQATFANVSMFLPWLTEFMFWISRPLIANRGLSLICLAVFLVLDCWILWRLSRSSGSRVLRELWSGIVVLVPSVLLCAFTLATIAPYVKVIEGMNKTRITALDAPERAGDHNQLGILLHTKGNLEGAIRCYRTALDLDPKYARADYNLGLALYAKGDAEGAIGCFRTAIDLDPKLAEAHWNLGRALQARGQFAEALAALKLGHAIGSQRPDWRYPSAEWVKTCETLLALNARLPDYLSGEVKPADANEQLLLARLCQEHKKLYAAATRFYAAAFAAEPKRAEDLQQPYRYNAACAAALAGCGKGEDVAQLDDQGRARLRQQALTWLRADLATVEKMAAGGRPGDRALVQQRMHQWQQDADLIGVRGDAISKLPEREREGWRKLWVDVESLRKREADKK